MSRARTLTNLTNRIAAAKEKERRVIKKTRGGGKTFVNSRVADMSCELRCFCAIHRDYVRRFCGPRDVRKHHTTSLRNPEREFVMRSRSRPSLGYFALAFVAFIQKTSRSFSKSTLSSPPLPLELSINARSLICDGEELPSRLLTYIRSSASLRTKRKKRSWNCQRFL